MNTTEAARRWATTWQRAWEAMDIEPIVVLYAEDAAFSSQPFREIHRGREGVRHYISGAFADEAAVRAWFGEPIVDGDRATVEWWAALREAGEEVTLAGHRSFASTSMGLFPGNTTPGTSASAFASRRRAGADRDAARLPGWCPRCGGDDRDRLLSRIAGMIPRMSIRGVHESSTAAREISTARAFRSAHRWGKPFPQVRR